MGQNAAAAGAGTEAVNAAGGASGGSGGPGAAAIIAQVLKGIGGGMQDAGMSPYYWWQQYGQFSDFDPGPIYDNNLGDIYA